MLKLVLTILFLKIALLLAEPRETVLIDGKKYTIVKEPPKNPECKGYEILIDDNGTEYCMAKTPDPNNSFRIEYDNSQYAECGRENLPDNDGARIIGGSSVEGIRFPWLARININGGLCTGSIITPRLIVFAAHCALSMVAEATVGVHSWRNTTRFDKYKGFISRANYTGEYRNNTQHTANDIAVLITFRTIDFNEYVGPICLPEAEIMDRIKFGTPVMAVGYGIDKSLESLMMKYKLIKTKQIKESSIAHVSIEMIKKVSYETFAELLPHLPEILDKNFKVLVVYSPETVKTFAEKNIETLKSSKLMKISDESDRITFQNFLHDLIKVLILGKYEDKEDFIKLMNKLAEIRISAELPQTMNYRIISPEPCNKALRRSTPPIVMSNMLCLKTDEKARVCQGDSGGPAAVFIDGKYYIAGVASGKMDSQSIPFQPWCTFSSEFQEFETLTFHEDIKPHLPFLKERMKMVDSMGNLIYEGD